MLPDRARVEVELNGEGKVVVEAGPVNFEGQSVRAERAAVQGKRTCAFELTPPSARAWSPETPWLHYCHFTVKTAGSVSDMRSEEFGLRTIQRDNDGTLRLNGQARMLRGACSFGNFWLDAAAGNREGIVRDILLFKAAQLEVTRVTVHVLPQLFYRLCDRYGLMVYEDTALQWNYPMDKEDHLRPEVRREAVRQLREMVDTLGNHPSIIIWSCMNEFYPKSYPKADPVFRRAMFDTCRAADPSRPIVVNSGAPPLQGTDSEADVHSDAGWYGDTAARNDPAGKRRIFFSPSSKGIVSEYGGVGLPEVLAQPAEPPKGKAATKTPAPPSIWAVLPLTHTIAAVPWRSDFVQADTSASFLRGLLPQDFREWNEQIGAICNAGLTSHPDIVPLVTTGMHQAQTALGLLQYGAGQIVLCQLLLADRAAHDLIVAEILSRLVAAEKISTPARLVLQVNAPLEARADVPLQWTAIVANQGGEDGAAELFTLDDRYQPKMHRQLRVAAGETVRAEVRVSASSSRAAAAETRDSVFMSAVSVPREQFGALALAVGARVNIVPLGATVLLPPGDVVRRFDFGGPQSPVARSACNPRSIRPNRSADCHRSVPRAFTVLMGLTLHLK